MFKIVQNLLFLP